MGPQRFSIPWSDGYIDLTPSFMGYLDGSAALCALGWIIGVNSRSYDN